MRLKRLFSGLVACTFILSLIPQITLSAATAESESGGRVNWTGYEDRNLDFDVWDGTSYDTSWYNEATGSESDPYIIDSAADLAGLQYMTNNSENIGYGTVTPLTTKETNFLSKLRYAFYDTEKDAFDPAAWYYLLSSTRLDKNVRYEATCDLVEYQLEYDAGKYVTTAYMDNVKYWLKVGDAAVQLKFDQNLADLVSDYYRFYFEPAKDYSETGVKPNYYPLNQMKAVKDDCCALSDIIIGGGISADWESNTFEYTAYYYNGGDTYTFTCDLDEFNILKGKTAVNAYGESIELNTNMVHQYEMYTSSLSTFSAVVGTVKGYPLSDTTRASGFNTFIGDLGATSVDTTNTDSHCGSEKIVFEGGYGEKADYSYFQDTTISTDTWYNALDSIVYAGHFGAPSYKVGVLYDWDAVNDDTMLVTLNVYTDDVLTSTVETSVDCSVDGISLPKFYGYDVNVTLDEQAQELTVTIPRVYKKGISIWGADTKTGTNTGDVLTVTIPVEQNNTATLYTLDGTDTGTYTNDGRYKLISSNCFAPAAFETWTINWATDATSLAQYNHLTCDNPSFKGKYIKLSADIDMSAAPISIFPNRYHDGYGLDGTFDLNGYAIKGVSNDFIGSINKTGVLKNGHIELDVANTNGPAVIYTTAGAISDVDFYAYSLLESEGIGEQGVSRHIVGTNNGEIRRCSLRTTTYNTESFVYENNNLISDCDWYYIEPTAVGDSVINTTFSSTPSSFFVYINNGHIQNICVDADENAVNAVYELAYDGQALIAANPYSTGTVDGFYMGDFTVKNTGRHAWIYAGGIVSNMETYVSFERNNISAYASMQNSTQSLTDSKIDMTSDCFAFNGDTVSGGISFYNCDVKYTGSTAQAYNNSYNGIFEINAIQDSKFDIHVNDNPAYNSGNTGKDPLFFSDYDSSIKNSIIDNSEITINLSHYTKNDEPILWLTKGEIINSEINLISPYGSDWGYAGLINCNRVRNSKINCPDVRGYATPIFGYNSSGAKICENSIVSVSYKGQLLPSSRVYNDNGMMWVNSEFYVHFDETAVFNSYDNGQYTNDNCPPVCLEGLVDSIIVMTSDSDDVVFEDEVILQGSGNYGEFAGRYENSTILLDGLTLSGADTTLFGQSNSNSSYNYVKSLENLTIISKNTKKATADTNVIVCDSISQNGLMSGMINGLYIDVEYADGHEETPTIGFHLRGQCFNGNPFILANAYMTSNTTSPKSALTQVHSNTVFSYGNPNLVFNNIFLDLPNAQTTVTPSETAEGVTTGFVSMSSDSSYYRDKYDDTAVICFGDVPWMGGYLLQNNMAWGNVLIPSGHSVLPQYYNADTTTPDSWNVESNLSSVYGGWFYGTDNDDSSHGNITKALDELSVIEFDTSDPDCYTDGSLAYALDNGSSQYRRSQSWTVIDAFSVYNPLTDELVWEQDAFTGLAAMHLPERVIITYDVNFEPVYKLTMLPADGGYVEVLGLADKITSDGSVYVKRNTSVPTNEVVANERLTFAYALQSFYDGATSRIPSTADSQPQTFARRASDPTDYTINGYTVYAADTTIQPVFGTARYITVNLTGSENGTIVPSTTVSIAGETIRLQNDIAKGYTVTNLAINGTPLTEMMFIMPDADVEITGEIIPFDGGITQFSVYGFDGLIDQINHTISVIIPKMGSLTNIQPEIEWSGKYLTPSESTRVDLSNPVTYTVTKDDDTTVDYAVTVTQSTHTMRIYEYEINGVKGDINHATRQITVELPAGTDLSALTPTNIVYSAESIAPTSNATQDFRAPVVYTLSTTGMQNVQYTVTVKALGSSDARIDEYVYSGYSGVIDHENGTITLNIPALLSTTDVVPSVLSYAGKQISPSKTTAVTLTDDIATTATYTVTSQNDTTKTYAIVANLLSDDTAKITKFELGGEEGIIDEDEKTITVTVSETVNITDVIPDSLIFEGKSIYPSINIERDFTQPQTYTVVAPDNSEVTYTIDIIRQKSGAEITEFAILGYEGVIDQTAKTITVDLPYGVDVSDVPPSKVVYSEGADISPEVTEKQDFTEEVKYTVTSEDGLNENEYTIIVNVADQYDNLITHFELDNVEGAITNIGASLGTITLTIKDYPNAPDWTNIVPNEIITSVGAVLTPDDTTARDFTNVLTYVVTGKLSGDRTYTVTTEIIPMSTVAEITKFTADGYTGIIDQENGTIKLRIPESKKQAMTNVTPVIEWKGKTLTPDGSVDLTNDITYTVTAEDPDIKKNYDIIVSWIDDSAPDSLDTTAEITRYKVNNITAKIDQTTKTITLNIPENKKADFTNVVPDITWRGYALTPSDTTPVDLTDDSLVYTVFAEDPSVTVEYTVTVNWTKSSTGGTRPVVPPLTPTVNDTARIWDYTIFGINASINQIANTITLNIPESLREKASTAIPDTINWYGKSIKPAANAAISLIDPPDYVVTAEAGNTRTYTMIINWINDGEPEKPVPDKPIVETEEPTIETEEPDEIIDTPDETVDVTDEPIEDEPDDKPEPPPEDPDNNEDNPNTSATDYTMLSALLALTSALMFVSKKRET